MAAAEVHGRIWFARELRALAEQLESMSRIAHQRQIQSLADELATARLTTQIWAETIERQVGEEN